jgi:hypothetical protein
MNQDELIQELSRELGLALKDNQYAAARKMLVDHINYLVDKDFKQLISILYRMDVNENSLRSMLKENPGADAGEIIADLMIERQARKINSRRQFRQRDNDIDEDEKW